MLNNHKPETNLAELLDILPVICYKLDNQSNITYLNHKAEVFFGISGQQMLGKNVRELVSTPEDRQYLAAINDTLTSRNQSSCDYFSNDTKTWVCLTVTPAPDGAIISIIDIDKERKGEEKAIRKSEERFHSFVAASFDTVYCMSADWGEMYTLTGKEFLMNTDSLSKNWVDTYISKEEHLRVWAAINYAISKKRMFELEHQVIRADGSIGWSYSRAVPLFDENCGIKEWMGTASDITFRKQAEQQLQTFNTNLEEEVYERTNELKENKELLRATLNSSLDMIQVFKAVRDNSGRIIDFMRILNNHASKRVYGDVSGKSLLAINPAVVKEGIFQHFVEVTEGGVAKQFETQYVHEQFDGWFLQSVVKLDDGVATSTADITQRKRAEEERIKSLLLLQQAEETAVIGGWE